MVSVVHVLLACLSVKYASPVGLNLNEHDICKRESPVVWRCQMYNTCKTAQAAIKRGEPPPLCGIKNGRAVVCCPPSGKPDIDKNKYTPKPTHPTNRPTPRTTKPPRPVTRVTNRPTAPTPKPRFPPGVLSEAMCEYYSRFVCEELPSISFTEDNGPTYKDSCKTLTPLITGGQNAAPAEFPHMALVGYGPKETNDWSCGGSLISERYVLTAAHCKEKQNVGPARRVKVGDYDVSSNRGEASTAVIYDVLETIVHPGYDATTRAKYHDIMLLRLAKDVEFGVFVRPLCLHRSPDIQSMNITATGWGLNETNGFQAKILQKVVFKIIDTPTCQPSYRTSLFTIDINDTTTVCAGDLKGNKDTCSGDSGGPLQVLLQSPYCMYSQVGITSLGNSFCGTGIPGIYTRVSYYISWIESIVWKHITQLPRKEALKC